jgi:hypothetical protein
MNPQQLAQLIEQRFKKSILPVAEFSPDDSKRIQERFDCALPEGFASMRAVIGIYRIEGGHLSVEEIIATCEAESAINPQWDGDFLPFYAIGNGDHLCLRRSECPNSAVYLIPHDEPGVTKLHDSFDEYLRDPKWFY